jgi:hypothetical protein
MIPQNMNHNFAYIILPLPYPQYLTSFHATTSPMAINSKEAIETSVKLEEDDSKRSTFVEPLPSPAPSVEPQRYPARTGPESTRNGCSKKEFKKDRRCPAQSCHKKYSSRIALRAHIRKEHPGWYEDTSDYEP